MHNPFLVLKRPGADENSGEVRGAVLAYSGSYDALVDVDSYGASRLLMGIGASDFTWRLDPGASFVTPEMCLAFSDSGLNGM